MSRHPSDTKVYVGELGNNASKQELEDAFGYYGHLRSVWVARNPPGFAFVEFEDPRDAEDAVRALDGRTVCGRRARVELSNGRSGRSRGGGRGGDGRRGGGDRGRAFHPEDKCYECGDRGHYARDCTRSGRGGGGRGGRGKRYVTNLFPVAAAFRSICILYIVLEKSRFRSYRSSLGQLLSIPWLIVTEC